MSTFSYLIERHLDVREYEDSMRAFNKSRWRAPLDSVDEIIIQAIYASVFLYERELFEEVGLMP